MPHDIYGTPEHDAFRATVRRFVEQVLVPRAREFDAAGRPDPAIFRTMGELGLLGIRYDPAWGGSGLDWSYSAVFYEEIGRADNAGVTMGITVQTDMATPSLAEFGSDELRQRFLVPALRGEHIAAIAVTEPDAGSDVAGIRTRAVRDGDSWVLNGSKIYITNASVADWLCLLAVTDPAAGYAGFTQILVPTETPGLSVSLLDKIGNWGSDTGQVFLEDVRVPVAHTIGAIGAGFAQQMQQFQDERLAAAITSYANAQRIWEVTRDYCEDRKLFGGTLAQLQVTQFKLVEALTQIAAARELTLSCVRKRIAGEDATNEISMAKLAIGRMSRAVADEMIQLHGGFGYMKESAAGRYFVDARLVSIGGGADEVMIQYLAKRLGIGKGRPKG